ncbi:hypothetical protein BT63DRAFT_461457 [Microthyrium microscopicum]|uniref:Uncharacterized protein n=1 Tax=Microthyrium microscopicum TaxID=703497 RepID=A0A6A6TWV4_9PEZI|nr:hypothetical protein BT63DRAFT_461457 [Microthyrium microscopicum]
MKLSTAFITAIAVHTAAGAAVNTDGALSNEEIIATILENPHLVPPTTYRMLQAKSSDLQKRQDAPATKSVAPKSTVPDVQDEPAKAWKDAKRRKVRYGPYRIPPTSEKNFASEYMNIKGMADTFAIGAKKPCDGECTILGLVGDIEYADGKPASNSQGAWFHHAVLLNTGPQVLDGNCGTSKIDNMFMSGNERSMNGYSLPNAKIKSGYRIHKDDSFVLTTELMNMQDKEQWVWLTISYEYLDGHQPDYKDGRMLWMSIGPIGIRCGGAAVKSPWGPSNLTLAQQPKLDVFSEHSLPWVAPRDGWILATGGHMHDGGVNLQVFHNDKLICTSTPTYAHDGHGMGGMRKRQIKGGEKSNDDIDHIKKQEGCNFLEGRPMKKGDTLYIAANYDFKRFPGMKNKKGELDEVMGISGSVVAY